MNNNPISKSSLKSKATNDVKNRANREITEINKRLREIKESYHNKEIEIEHYLEGKKNLEESKKSELTKIMIAEQNEDPTPTSNKIETKEKDVEETKENEKDDDGEKEGFEEELPEEKKNNYPQEQFAKLIDEFYNLNPFSFNDETYKELEVRFGTRGIKPLTKNDYDNIIIKLKSLGFTCDDNIGLYSLRIQNELLDTTSGTFKMSNIRTEIEGIDNISKYCNTNSISYMRNIKFTKKMPARNEKDEILKTVNNDDWNFRISLQNEIVKKSNKYMVNNWKTSKKTFRYINRVTFIHPNYPVNVDISIVKNSSKDGRDYKKFTNIQDSGVFTSPETYEVELEIQNSNIGPGTNFNSAKLILEMLKKVIKWVLSGLQNTNYPISYKEQRDVLNLYMRLLYQENYNPNKRIYNSDFIGPSSYTLQMQNISEINDNTTVPNIRKNYTVTEKADGTRHLLYISPNGKIYLINTNMQIIFTGAITKEKLAFNSLIDGELILHDKNGEFINLYAAFDLYYHNNKDVRSWTFIQKKKDENSRLILLKNIIKNLKLTSSWDNQISSPIQVKCKQFYPSNPEIHNIFEACNEILTREKDNLFEYNTDGLIFTPAYMGVASDSIGKSGPLTKITWEHSFKWKPPQYNTIDFMVSTVKSNLAEDTITPIFESGSTNKLSEYKQLILMCTFIPRKHGYINPCQDVIDDKLPEYINMEEDKQDLKAVPMQFYPTNPSDQTAGITNILLKYDDNFKQQMFSEENEVFGDNTIVEFRYDMEREPGWKWVPLRVRYDKTAELRQGLTNYGNAYHVANSNWQSINNPITEKMMSDGLNIPDIIISDDVYYNKGTGVSKTKAMRDFHNLYVKKSLITSVSKKDNILIDYACGKGGDLSKWIDSRLSFVFGVDISKDNLEHKFDGACARFLNYRKKFKKIPYVLFVNGNSAYNIKSGEAMMNDKAKEITQAVFGKGHNNEEKLGLGVYRQFGKGADGFNVSSCQFALHYFLQNIDTFRGFLKNVTECTKVDGYFIATTYDGKSIFNLLKHKKMGESIQTFDSGKKIWEIVKQYEDSTMEDNSSCIGYKIEVYQETINQLIPEYLVNFDYFNRIMENYGFALIDRAEADMIGFPSGGTGMFDDLYRNMIIEIKKNKAKENDYGTAIKMNSFEKQISFLNRYYIYKKIRNVNPDKVEIDLSDYVVKPNEDDKYEKINPEIEEKIVKKKIRKLNKRLILEPSTEVLEYSIEKPEEKEVVVAVEEKNVEEKSEEIVVLEKPEEKEEIVVLEKPEEKEKPVTKKKPKFRFNPRPEIEIDYANLDVVKETGSKKVSKKKVIEKEAKEAEKKVEEEKNVEEKSEEKSEEKKTRCKKGTRKNKKTGDCEKKNA